MIQGIFFVGKIYVFIVAFGGLGLTTGLGDPLGASQLVDELELILGAHNPFIEKRLHVFVGSAPETHDLFPPLPRPVVTPGHVAGNRSKGQFDHSVGVKEGNDLSLLVVADVVLGNDLFGRDDEFTRRGSHREIIDGRTIDVGVAILVRRVTMDYGYVGIQRRNEYYRIGIILQRVLHHLEVRIIANNVAT